MLGEFAREIVELAFGPPPLKLAVIDRADASGIVAAIFEAFESVEQALRDVRLSDDANNPAHLLGSFPGHPFAETLGPAGDPLLLAALKRETVRLDVACDDRAGADNRSVTNRHRRHERGVRADEGACADLRRIFAEPIVIARNRSCPDVGVGPDRRIADVGQVIDLRTLGDFGVLELDEIADLGLAGKPRAGAEPGKWADARLCADGRPFDMAEGVDCRPVGDLDAGT